ncbi:hypothetical protein BDP81DRAFT_86849 [Colletotrichum phormii]|uniref:Uncharacterized protein n=1 Tax=Colletotrichum phormii TaxID=359342 RepID=A0AAJ0A1D4_9PEZI|nr:uncharacterized protein BDP81DRAFT_86849 [Colletotrichum phormii]KAK1654673.1 hypothetical protein BDP81DRAFT_86849 [Colletotrichum phormii]
MGFMLTCSSVSHDGCMLLYPAFRRILQQDEQPFLRAPAYLPTLITLTFAALLLELAGLLTFHCSVSFTFPFVFSLSAAVCLRCYTHLPRFSPPPPPLLRRLAVEKISSSTKPCAIETMCSSVPLN